MSGELQRVPDVAGDRPPRQEARLLEHEADVRIGAAHLPVIEEHAARVGRQQARDDPEQGALAGAVGPDERDDLAGLDRQVNVIEGDEALARRVEGPTNALELEPSASAGFRGGSACGGLARPGRERGPARAWRMRREETADQVGRAAHASASWPARIGAVSALEMAGWSST
jgi:hypothetical protein